MPLHFAAWGGHAAVAAFLIQRGAPVNVESKFVVSTYMFWCPVIKVCLQGREVSSEFGETATAQRSLAHPTSTCDVAQFTRGPSILQKNANETKIQNLK